MPYDLRVRELLAPEDCDYNEGEDEREAFTSEQAIEAWRERLRDIVPSQTGFYILRIITDVVGWLGRSFGDLTYPPSKRAHTKGQRRMEAGGSVRGSCHLTQGQTPEVSAATGRDI